MNLSVSTSLTVLLSLTLFIHFPLCTKSPMSKTSQRLTMFYKHSDCSFVWFGFSFWQKAGENSLLNFPFNLVISTFCISEFFQITHVLMPHLTSAISVSSGKFFFYSDAVLFVTDTNQTNNNLKFTAKIHHVSHPS